MYEDLCLLVEYIVRCLILRKGPHRGMALAFKVFDAAQAGDKKGMDEIAQTYVDVRKVLKDLGNTLWKLRMLSALKSAKRVLDGMNGQVRNRVCGPMKRRRSSESSLSTTGGSTYGSPGASSHGGRRRRSADFGDADSVASSRRGSPARDDETEGNLSDDSEDDYIGSDTESCEDDTETASELAEAFEGTYFKDVEWTARGSCVGFTLSSPDWRDWVSVVARMGELLEAPKTLEAIMVLRISCRLMEDDFEAQDLVDPTSSVFESFWKRGRSVCSCIMQGGKTRRCILLRGYVHAGVHNKHAVVLANGMATSYGDLKSAMQDLNEDYKGKIPEAVRKCSPFLPEFIFLYTRLNMKPGFDALQKKDTSMVHFNVRLSNMAGLISMAAPFRGMLQGGFQPSNTHLILDESHEALGKRMFACAVRERLAVWEDTTLVTATPIAQFVVPEWLGSSFRLVEVAPRPGYYLYGPNMERPTEDSEDGKILVVKYVETDARNENAASAGDSDDAGRPLKEFPYEYFPLPGKRGRKRMRLHDPEANAALEACAPPAEPLSSIPEEYVTQLAKLAKAPHSYFNIVLNEIQGKCPEEGKSSINIGHAVIAKWIVQNASKGRDQARRVAGGKRASLVSYTVYQHSRVSSEFAKPRLFFNRTFLRALGRQRGGARVDKLFAKVFTTNPAEANSRVLLKERRFAELRDYFCRITERARKLYNGSQCASEKLLAYGDDTFSLELPRLEIKAVLSLVRHLHEGRFQQPEHSYETMPLRLTIVGNTLLKQSVNVESKCRELQSTHLTYIRKDNAAVDLVRLLQKLGRVDHGHTESAFYRSAFPGAEDVADRRPTVLMPQALIKLVQRSPARQQDAVMRGRAIVLDFLRETAELSTKASSLQRQVTPLNEIESAAHRVLNGRSESTGAAPEGAETRVINQDLLQKLRHSIRAWDSAVDAAMRNKMAQEIHDQIVVGYEEDQPPTLDDLRTDYTFDDADHTAVTRNVYKFLMQQREQ